MIHLKMRFTISIFKQLRDAYQRGEQVSALYDQLWAMHTPSDHTELMKYYDKREAIHREIDSINRQSNSLGLICRLTFALGDL